MQRTLLAALAIFACLELNATVVVKTQETVGPIKAMNAVNNGPKIAEADRGTYNFSYYKALNIPYARTHDANFAANYGAPHTVDIDAIFPDFDKKVNDPESYDFTHTDMYLKSIMSAGTRVFFRLGQKIEHSPKKYGVMPPKDYKKWAQICEHIIRHYNEGWADGFHLGIQYWEIWNEPDLDVDTWETNPRCWGGPKEEFFKFYETAARHLDKCFPDLKIGGPAVAGDMNWVKEFLEYMGSRNVPMDFFSWHIYATVPEDVVGKCMEIRELLDKYGYTDAESILNEWNYVKGWNRDFIYSLDAIRGIKGAAFAAAVMSACQDAPVDMLMYYDFRIGTGFNGAFDAVTDVPLKGYYTFYAWNKLAEYGTQVRVCTGEDDPGIFATAARSPEGNIRLMMTRYSDDDNKAAYKQFRVKVEGLADGTVFAHVTDYMRSYTEIPLEVVNGEIAIIMQPLSTVVIEL